MLYFVTSVDTYKRTRRKEKKEGKEEQNDIREYMKDGRKKTELREKKKLDGLQ